MFTDLKRFRILLVICTIGLAGCVPQNTPTTAPIDPTPTATPGAARIVTFEAIPSDAAPGDLITLRWQTSDTFGVEIVKRLPNDTNGLILASLPSSGETTVRLEPSDVPGVTFILTASTAGDPVTAEVDVAVACIERWFFANTPQNCPLWPADLNAGDGAIQPFEHGQVIYSGGDGWAVVLYDDGAQPAWERLYPDFKPEAPVTSSPSLPPDGLYEPFYQIGAVWRSEVVPGRSPGLRLGWATGPQVDIATNYQCDSPAFYDPTTGSAPCYITGPNGAIIRLASDPVTRANFWEILP